MSKTKVKNGRFYKWRECKECRSIQKQAVPVIWVFEPSSRAICSGCGGEDFKKVIGYFEYTETKGFFSNSIEHKFIKKREKS